MKITVVCDAFGPDNNRTVVAAHSLIREMKQRGHEVAVVCSDMTKAGKEGYVVISRPDVGAGMHRLDKEKLEAAVWDSDVVHIMTASALGFAAVKLCKQHLIPVSADFRAPEESLLARYRLSQLRAAKGLTYRHYYYSLYRYADAIRFPSDLNRKLFEKAIGHQTDAYIIPDGVDERFRPNGAQKPPALRERFVILYCAPYNREKNHGILIDAAERSKHSGKIQLILAGSGPLKRELKQQGKKLKNQPILTDYPYSLLPNLYCCADLYVHPALVDMDAASCMEALACGLVPLIADSSLSAAKRFAPDSRYLFDSRSAQALAEKIDDIIEHQEELDRYREKYAGIVAELSCEACMDRLEEMLYDIR